jgi:hypothetical protein
MAPALLHQVLNFVRHGSPIYPFRFELFGIKLGNGVTMKELFEFDGLRDYSLRGFWNVTKAAYFVPARWPYCFFDSRNFGDGIFAITTLLTLPLSVPRMNSRTRVLLVTFVVLSIVAKDFFLPRYAYGLLTVFCICNALAMRTLVDHRRLALLYPVALGVVALHAFRPEWDMWRLSQGEVVQRLNVTGSTVYTRGDGIVPLFPDLNAHLLIVRQPGNNFVLPLFGRKLTNTVVTSIAKTPGETLGPRCAAAHAYTDRDPDMLVVDDEDLTKNCARTCVVDGGWRCAAFKLLPEL